MNSNELYASYRSMTRDEIETSLLAVMLERDQLQGTLDLIDKVMDKEKKSFTEGVPLWNVIDSEGHLYTVEADFYHVEEDGSLAFYKERDGFPSSPVGVAAAYSWVFARRAR